MRRGEIVVGTFTRSLVIRLAEAAGKFDAAGIRVVEKSVTSSAAQFASLEAGEYDAILTGPDNVIAYRLVRDNPLGRLMPVEILAGIDRGLGLSLCTAPGVRAGADIGRLGVDVAISGFAFLAYGLLERIGLAPGRYEVLSLGATPRRADALIDGQCHASILNAGNELRAGRAGCETIGSVVDCGPYLGTVLAALPARDREALEARELFREVLEETIAEILADRSRPEFVLAARETLGLDAAAADEHYAVALSGDHGYIADGAVPRDALETVLRLRHRYAPAPETVGGVGLLEPFVPSTKLC